MRIAWGVVLGIAFTLSLWGVSSAVLGEAD